MELTESFYSGLYVFLGGFILAVLGLAYRSKCDTVRLCYGCVDIHRNVEVEMKEDLKKMEFEDAKDDV
jgi:hypothetical protein